jgi:hypothetical protein
MSDWEVVGSSSSEDESDTLLKRPLNKTLSEEAIDQKDDKLEAQPLDSTEEFDRAIWFIVIFSVTMLTISVIHNFGKGWPFRYLPILCALLSQAVLAIYRPDIEEKKIVRVYAVQIFLQALLCFDYVVAVNTVALVGMAFLRG